jgi:hypothetical protein
MDEQIFFENGKVTVSKNQFIVENQTFTLDSIASIKIETIPPSRRLSGNTAIIGALCLSLDELFFVIGLILLAVAGFLWKRTKPQYSIILNTASGEKQALVSDNEEYIKQVFFALNEALVSRA